MSATLTASTAELVQRIHRESLPGRLVHLAHDRGDDPALREKRLGVWQERSWAGYRDEVLAAAIAMLDAGVGRGDHRRRDFLCRSNVWAPQVESHSNRDRAEGRKSGHACD